MPLGDSILDASMFGAFGVPGNNLSRQLGGLRAMRYLRPQVPAAPHAYTGRPAQRVNPLLGQGIEDYSPYTYDSRLRSQAESMGIHPLTPEQVNPYAFFPNSGFFGAHPMLTRGLEGAMFGAAATQGADTWGEGISNIASGLMQGRAMRDTMLRQQFATPFQNAESLEKLRGLGIDNTLHEAMVQHYRAQTDKLREGTPDRFTAVENGILNTATGEVKANPYADHTQGRMGGNLPAGYLPILAEEGMDPTKMTAKDWERVNKKYYQYQTGLAYGRSRAGIQAGIDTDTKETVADKNEQKRQNQIENALLHAPPAYWATAGINPLASPEVKRKYLEEKVYPPSSPTPNSPAAAPAKPLSLREAIEAMHRENQLKANSVKQFTSSPAPAPLSIPGVMGDPFPRNKLNVGPRMGMIDLEASR